MLEKIKLLFDSSGKDKIEFKPAIRIKMSPHAPIIWIDSIYKVKGTYMLAVSTINDSLNMNLNIVDDTYLSGILIRLNSPYGKAVPAK